MVGALDDRSARAAALDPARSFIVQAPAGSGKTELLIQRYLALLASVEEPEQVVAITFTRKAAAEMRRRVLEALRAAAAAEPVGGEHQAVTRRLAEAVVDRDAQRDWSLQSLPQRLRIDTLDAFNVHLARRLPLLSDGVAAAQITEDASSQYAQAARRTVAQIGDGGALGHGLRGLLRSLDNDQAALADLLAGLLPRREQWLEPLAGSSEAELRERLEQALQELVADELERLATAWPEAALRELRELGAHAARCAEDAGVRATLDAWLVGSATTARLEGWQAVARLLLTQRGEWRRQASKPHGFGAAHPEARERLRGLLETLAAHEPLRGALQAVAELPMPQYTSRQWAGLAALQTVLIHLAAELKVLFAEQRCVDFVELSLAAQRALGRADAPSELLLALDRRIQHLLVDEFQDTSQAQLRLLELLTAGWQPDDGRSLFLVGDPMQSIYRFRDADMGLFLKVKQRGIGAIELTHLRLQSNFRSAPAVVDWVNGVFARVFPPQDDIAAGSAAFAPCRAARAAAPAQLVRVHGVRSADSRAEVERVVALLGEELARQPRQAIAVLVQSRTHLAGLRERLDAEGWPVHAVEIDAPAERQLGQDLIGLTRALTHLGDRIAWLGILRAPWCGLTWQDLHALCHDSPERTIWELLHDRNVVDRLSPEGRRRAEWLVAVLGEALAARATLPFAHWVEETWRRLDGPECLAPGELEQAEQFFAALARHERHGDVDDPAILEGYFAKAERQGDPPHEAGIEIMTMHRAKGLEFDTVILLGLGREPRRDDPKALYWLQRIGGDGREHLLMAPLAARGDDLRLTELIKRTERRRDLVERARLLYVASTRARERLHLVGQLWPGEQRPAPGALLAHLWPHIEQAFPADTQATPPTAAEAFQPVLRRLGEPAALSARRPPDTVSPIEPAHARPEFAWSSTAAVHVGTVVHRHLQRIAEEGLQHWSDARVSIEAPRLRGELQLLGVSADALAAATERTVTALRQVLDDPQGRWLLAGHPQARSELRLTLLTADGLEHVKLDRTFVDGERRWIIDYKTGRHEGSSAEAFLESEVERYRPQLERYAAALAAIDAREIMLGLYFPLLRAFRSWPAARSSAR